VSAPKSAHILLRRVCPNVTSTETEQILMKLY
jgi:hypothetical protein